MAAADDTEREELVVEERGQVRFFARPRVERGSVIDTLDDVQRFFFVLRATEPPHPARPARRVAVGRKRMPDRGRHERVWAYVDKVGATPRDVLSGIGPGTYATKTRGVRHQPGAIEVARGDYAIVAHGRHGHFVYALEDADEDVASSLWDELRLAARSSTIAAVMNPLRKRGAPPPSDDDAPFGEPSLYPDELLDRFEGRRFAPLSPDFLDHEGAEIVLIGGGHVTLVVDYVYPAGDGTASSVR